MKYTIEVAGKSVTIFGEVDEDVVKQISECMKSPYALQGAIMADGHVGYDMPIGGVVAYDNAVHPMGVGYDIACGNKAVMLNTNYYYVLKHIEEIMDEIFHTIPFGVGVGNDGNYQNHDVFRSSIWTDIEELKTLKPKAREQLGSLGSGNHFVDIFSDEDRNIWIGVHSGSRGFGYKIASGFHALSAGKKFDERYNGKSKILSLDSELGQRYMSAMTLAGDYAYANRDSICAMAAEIVGGIPVIEVHNNHNFAWREYHATLGDVIVIRKGGTPAFDGQGGFIGATMEENSVIVSGIQSEESIETLCSTVHGAGRTMSRSKAKKTFNKEEMLRTVAEAGVVLKGAGLDEYNLAYKRLDEVLEHHNETIDVIHTLKPLGVAMAGKGR